MVHFQEVSMTELAEVEGCAPSTPEPLITVEELLELISLCPHLPYHCR